MAATVGAALQATLSLLAKTNNQAAVELLVAALDSTHAETRSGAVRSLAQRTSAEGHAAILRRLHQIEGWRELLAPWAGFLSQALRNAVLGPDRQTCENACQAVLLLREYDLMPALLAVLEAGDNPNAGLASHTLLELAELLYQELAGPRDYRIRRDPQLVRRHVTASLEKGVSRIDRHRSKEVAEAFLLLAARENSTLKQILLDPFHTAHLPVVDVLLHSQRPGVVRLLLSYLDDPQAPSSAIAAIARRGDVLFIRHLLKKIGYEPSPTVAHNLKRIESAPWLRPQSGVLATLDDAAQYSAVKVLMASGIKRLEAFGTIEYLATSGTPGGRRAAYEALIEFNGAESNALAVRGLSDPDPLVQAAVARQLRQRGVPGAMSRLIELLDSRHQVVRDAVRETLVEFQFRRFLANFDLLEPAARRSTGALVRKVDPEAIPQLVEELQCPARSRRLRGIEMAVAMGAEQEVERQLLERLRDEDHLIRGEAARALAGCDSAAAQQGLYLALTDRSMTVQEIAQQSLDEMARRRPPLGPLAAASLAAADDTPGLAPAPTMPRTATAPRLEGGHG